MREPLLNVTDLQVHFPLSQGFFSRSKDYVYAVDGVSLFLNPGETLGVVGESGCGKTTCGLAILNLVEPTGGKVEYQGKDITNLSALTKTELRALRKEMQIIFQDPYSSLNPRMTLRQILGVPMKIHGLYNGRERQERIDFLLEKVGLAPEHGTRFPHEFSGGQRQRIGIARALCLDPRVVIGDEPVSALDVSIQAQIINLLMDLQEEFNLSYIVIAHDLAVVEHISDRIMVMYLGKVVESAPYRELFINPLHPYTQALLSAVPNPDPRARRRRIELTGDVPSPRRPPRGCSFHPRCFRCLPECEEGEPALRHIGGDHWVACHR
jgi:oligopeptide/dipeptide ABC transporter ATP-binding protein